LEVAAAAAAKVVVIATGAILKRKSDPIRQRQGQLEYLRRYKNLRLSKGIHVILFHNIRCGLSALVL